MVTAEPCAEDGGSSGLIAQFQYLIGRIGKFFVSVKRIKGSSGNTVIKCHVGRMVHEEWGMHRSAVP